MCKWEAVHHFSLVMMCRCCVCNMFLLSSNSQKHELSRIISSMVKSARFRNFLTFIAARCSRVSPLWFFFITAGLPDVARPTDARGEGDFLPTMDGKEGLALWSSLGFLVLLSDLGLVKDGGLRTDGDMWLSDFLLQPGEALGRFGVVSKVTTFSSSLDRLEESGFRGDMLACFSGLSIGVGSFSDNVSGWVTLFDVIWESWVWFLSIVVPSLERLSLKVLLPELRQSSLILPWGSLDMRAGLRKETRLLDLLAASAHGCSFSIKVSTSSVIPHCWFMSSSFFFFICCLVCFWVVLVAPCSDAFLLAEFFLFDLFFLLLFTVLHVWEQEEPESWEDEVKLKTARSLHWSVVVSGCAEALSLEDPLSGKVISGDFSIMQRTLRLRGLNQILKFFLCFKTVPSDCVGIITGEETAVRWEETKTKSYSAH